MQSFQKILSKILSKPYSKSIILGFSTNFLAFSYIFFSKNQSWEEFTQSNPQLFTSIFLLTSIILAITVGINVSLSAYLQNEQKRASLLLNLGTFLIALFSIFFNVERIEPKILGIFILLYLFYTAGKKLAGSIRLEKQKNFITFDKNSISLNLNNYQFKEIFPLALLVAFILLTVFLPRISPNLNVGAENKQASLGTDTALVEKIYSQINPQSGYNLKVKYGDLGPRMLKNGVIDLDKFTSVYETAGNPLNDEQMDILTKGSDKEITIDAGNSYFLLNFFWAVGLGNKNQILEQGDLMKYGGLEKVDNFASTGGWSLSKSGNVLDYYAKENLLTLTPEQQKLVEEVSSQIYRPCCNNPTSFPDCNHGMALLGILELMAANGADKDTMFEAAKYINAYWFPSTYFDLVEYFQKKEDIDFQDIDAEKILGKEYSSASGWSNIKKLLESEPQSQVEKAAPKSGTGCGV